VTLHVNDDDDDYNILTSNFLSRKSHRRIYCAVVNRLKVKVMVPCLTVSGLRTVRALPRLIRTATSSTLVSALTIGTRRSVETISN